MTLMSWGCRSAVCPQPHPQPRAHRLPLRNRLLLAHPAGRKQRPILTSSPPRPATASTSLAATTKGKVGTIPTELGNLSNLNTLARRARPAPPAAHMFICTSELICPTGPPPHRPPARRCPSVHRTRADRRQHARTQAQTRQATSAAHPQQARTASKPHATLTTAGTRRTATANPLSTKGHEGPRRTATAGPGRAGSGGYVALSGSVRASAPGVGYFPAFPEICQWNALTIWQLRS